MSGGVIVVAGVVGALALWETVLPRAFAALRKWRREQARAKKEREKKADGDVPVAGRAVLSPPQPSSNAASLKGDGILTGDATLAFPNSGAATEGSVVAASEDAQIAHRESDPHSKEERDTDANRLWEEARTMTHRFNPDWEKDQEYLSKIYTAARLGHLKAMVKLGEYAYRRGAVVEAYYWTALAELKGAKGLDAALREMKTRWLSKGCPAEHRNAYDGFSEMQGSFARALLRIRCAVGTPLARARMRELAEQGCEEARLFLDKWNR